ncbi:MAG TPA: glycosyltransferase family 39 protein [Blastocatellia bacterium]
MKSTLDRFSTFVSGVAPATVFPRSTAPAIEGVGAVTRGKPGRESTGRGENTRGGLADVAALAILILLVAQLFLCSRMKSATYDEQYHIANGLAFLRTGDSRLIPEHPPLINLISALPLLADGDLVLPLDDPCWIDVNSLKFSDLLLWKLNPDGPSIVARARVPIIILTLFLAVIVYAWGREMYGPAAGLFALALLVFDPNILAHGCLATNDLGLTCFATLALYAFWRLLRRPGLDRAFIAGLALGLAQVSKFSALFLLPALAVTFLADRISRGASAPAMRRAVVYLAVVILTAAFTIWAVYGFQMGTLRGYTVPARAYLSGLQEFTHLLESGKRSFLLGSYSDTGWWYYFPVAFAVKTPLPTLLLIAFALFYTCRHRTWRRGLPLLIPVGIYFGVCLASPFNIGYRHLLPVLPLLFIFVGQVASLGLGLRRKQTWAVCAALVWLVGGSLTTFPHYLAYFNELVGGPGGGYKVLVDSNLDWGQDLIGLREYMARENISSVRLSYIGTADPCAYGITYEPLPGFPYHQWQGDGIPEILSNPAGGVYAISASNLQGLRFKNPDLYAKFRERKPDAVIGYSIFIYRIPDAEGRDRPR